MIPVSKVFKQELYNGRQDYLLSAGIAFADGTEKELNDADIWESGISVEDAVSSDNSFDIGAAITNRCTLVINNMYDKFSTYDFTSAEVVPYVKLELPDGTIEPVRKGTFTVDEADYDEELITLSCLDNMQKFDKPYSLSRLVYPATLGEIVRDACGVCEVYLQTQTFPHHNFVIQSRPADEAATFREVISWAAQIACCFCRCDVYGRLELKWYNVQALEAAALDGGSFKPWTGGDTIDGGTFNPWTGGTVYDGGTFGDRDNIHHIYSSFSVDIATDDVVITGVRVLEKTKEDDKDAIVTYQSGTDGYVISVENNDLIQGGAGQEIADWLGEQLIGLRFRPASVTHLSDPTIEGGDVGFLTDRKGRTYRIVVSNTHFTAGDSQSTSCNAKTPARNSAVRYSAQTKAYIENRKNFEKERTDRQLALDTLAGLLSSSPGMYATEDPPGNPNAVRYLHDKPTVAESKNVIKFTSEAIGISNDGGKTYPYGLILTGDAILNKIYAIGIDAGYIKTGILSVGDTGKEALYVNFHTKEVRVRPEKFSLASGKTIEDIAQEKSDSALGIAKEYANGKILDYSSTVNSSLKVVSDAISAEVTRATKAEGVIDGNIKTVNETLSSKIDHTAESITLSVSKTYSTKTETTNALNSANKSTDEKLKSYSTTAQMNSAINQKAGEISLSASLTYETKTDADTQYRSFESKFTVIDTQISSKVTSGDVASLIEQKADSIRLKAGNISWSSDYSSMTESGVLTCTGANIGGRLNGATGTFSGSLNAASGTFNSLASTGDASESGAKIGMNARALYAMDAMGNYGIYFLFLNKVNMPAGSYDLEIYNCKANGVLMRGNFTVSGGTKSKLASTKNYDDRLLYCYEMPSPMFGDIGGAMTDENGECYVYLDDIFAETVAAGIEYQVFLQKEGPGDIWVQEKTPIYFLVRGTENLKFAWEIKAKQKGYEFERLETPLTLTEVESESEYLFKNQMENYIKEQEELLYATA